MKVLPVSAVPTRFRRNGGRGFLGLACKERWQSRCHRNLSWKRACLAIRRVSLFKAEEGGGVIEEGVIEQGVIEEGLNNCESTDLSR